MKKLDKVVFGYVGVICFVISFYFLSLLILSGFDEEPPKESKEWLIFLLISFAAGMTFWIVDIKRMRKK